MEILKTEKGSLSVLAGQTDMGKSTMAVFNCAEQLKQGKNVVFFSYEYCQSVIFNKLVSHFGLNWTELYSLVVVDGKGMGMAEIRSIIESRKDTVDALYIDYLDLLRQVTSLKNGLENINKIDVIQSIVSDLAEIASKYNIAVVLLTQAKADASMDDIVDWLNMITATVHSPAPTFNMFINRNEAMNPIIKSNDVSHVILVEGKELSHFSSINLKEAYKY